MRSKKEITRLLEENRLGELTAAIPDRRKLLTLLISSTYEKEKLVTWRAIEAIGLISAEIAEHDTEFVMNLVRRLVWMCRDESGGIGWSVPEILGEIVRRNPVLCEDFATIITSFHDEDMLAAGVLRAIGRIGKISEEAVDFALPVVNDFMDSENRAQRGNAIWAFGEIGPSGDHERLEKFRNDTDQFLFYEEGELKSLTVGELAKRAIHKLAHSGLIKEAC